MTFELDYTKWVEKHFHNQKGERKGRFETGHGHAEKKFLENVWYPAFKQFEHLNPEYEIADFRDGTRYLDFAYIQYPLSLAIEIDGFSSHAGNITRWQFSDSLIRQNHLVLDGWKILRFSYDDVNEKPRFCQQLLQQFMGSRLVGHAEQTSLDDILELEIIRLAMRLHHHIRPSDVSEFLQISTNRAQKLLHSMRQKHSLLPAGDGNQRIRCYKVNMDYLNKKRLQI